MDADRCLWLRPTSLKATRRCDTTWVAKVTQGVPSGQSRIALVPFCWARAPCLPALPPCFVCCHPYCQLLPAAHCTCQAPAKQIQQKSSVGRCAPADRLYPLIFLRVAGISASHLQTLFETQAGNFFLRVSPPVEEPFQNFFPSLFPLPQTPSSSQLFLSSPHHQQKKGRVSFTRKLGIFVFLAFCFSLTISSFFQGNTKDTDA